MGVYSGAEISEEGLVLCLDAANPRSYGGSGATWSDLSGRGHDGTLVNNTIFNGTTVTSAGDKRWTLGRRRTFGSHNNYLGRMDEVGFFNFSLLTFQLFFPSLTIPYGLKPLPSIITVPL